MRDAAGPCPWRVEIHDSLASTQDLLRERAGTGEAEGLVVQSLSQTAGRGRQGTLWTSPAGNLYISVLLRPHCPLRQSGQIALLAGAALARSVASQFCGKRRVGLKWPNDLLLDGRKAAGILVETQADEGAVQAALVGIGVNVLSPPEGAASLTVGDDGAVGSVPASFDPGGLLGRVRDALLTELALVYKIWKQEGFAPVREIWLEHAESLGQTIRVGKPPQKRYGKFMDLGPEGALIFLPEGAHQPEQVFSAS